jgi:O-antigen/teichoic acid export membrane protein
MFGYLFASLLLPMFARMLKQGEPLRPLVSLSFKLIWAGSVTLAAAIFFAREDLVGLMMPLRANEYRFEVLGLLIWAFVPVSVTYIFSTLLTAGERMRHMNRFFLVGIALDLVLNLCLIPHYQAFGAALAALTTQVFIAGSMVWLAAGSFDLWPTRRGAARLMGFAALVVVADEAVFSVAIWPWPWKFAAGLLVGLAAALVFRLVELRRFKTLVLGV